MIPLLLILLAGVAWGETSTLELHGRELVQPFYDAPEDKPTNPEKKDMCGEDKLCAIGYIDTRNPHWIPVIEDKPTYVVEVSSVCVKTAGIVLTSNPPIVPCEKWKTQYTVAGIGFWSKEQADDMAEALNEAHRRRVK